MDSRPILLSFTAISAMLAASCARSSDAQPRPVPIVPTVAVAKVTTETLSRDLVLTAEFKPYQEIDVMAKVAGYVKTINVDVGDRVRQGALLATLEIPEMGDDLRRADAAVQRGSSDIQHARDELKRAESAHEMAHLGFERLSSAATRRPGLIAQQEIDDARARDLVAEAQISAAKSALASTTQQVDVTRADAQKVRTLLDYTRVTAPFAGVITKRFADTGSMIQAGTASQTQAMPVVRLSDNSMLRLILPVPESSAPTVHIGQQVQVRVPTLNRTFPGRVARFAGKLSTATRTMETEVDVANPSLILIPGMYAEVDLTLESRPSVLTIPTTAVDSDSRVMVITPTSHVEERSIALGLETSSKVEVRSGLNEGDLVILTGRAALRPGQEVRTKIATLAEVH